MRLTGQGSPRKAFAAIKASRDRGWDAYRSIEHYMTSGEICRRRQILDHFGDDEPGAPDRALLRRLRGRRGAGGSGRRRRSRPRALAAARQRGAGGRDAAGGPPVDEQHFERLRAWRFERAEGKPAYTVASNAVLEDAAARDARQPQALLEIRGIGPAFCEKHGESLLAELAALQRPARAARAPAASARGPPMPR